MLPVLLQDAEILGLRNLFESLDDDQSGSLTVEELQRAMASQVTHRLLGATLCVMGCCPIQRLPCMATLTGSSAAPVQPSFLHPGCCPAGVPSPVATLVCAQLGSQVRSKPVHVTLHRLRAHRLTGLDPHGGASSPPHVSCIAPPPPPHTHTPLHAFHPLSLTQGSSFRLPAYELEAILDEVAVTAQSRQSHRIGFEEFLAATMNRSQLQSREGEAHLRRAFKVSARCKGGDGEGRGLGRRGALQEGGECWESRARDCRGRGTCTGALSWC